jgi:VIT1/CCC1 family predicted Fe2+/Mn2+ transporter
MEAAQTEVERKELETDNAAEHKELANIYAKRGLTAELAKQVAAQLMAHDALDAHLRDELGITPMQRAQPLQAALASATSFAVGAALPLCSVMLAPTAYLSVFVSCASLAVLAALGSVAARAGGAPVRTGALRVLVWGAVAMAITAGAGALFGAAA